MPSQFLDAPIVMQLLTTCKTNGFHISSTEMNGERSDMEDETDIQTNLMSESSASLPSLSSSLLSANDLNNEQVHWAGLYDGHAGDKSSQFLKEQLSASISKLKKQDQFDETKIEMIIRDLDTKFHSIYPTERSGCTIASAIFSSKRALIFHVGDSRVVAFNNKTGQILYATSDHKPTNKDETARILKAGGFVEDERVCGHLGLSRAFGDWGYKLNNKLAWDEQLVICKPVFHHISFENQENQDDIDIVLFCDGMVEETLTNQNIVDEILHLRQNKTSLVEIARHLPKMAIRDRSSDNISVILIHRENEQKDDMPKLTCFTDFIIQKEDLKDLHSLEARHSFIRRGKNVAKNYLLVNTYFKACVRENRNSFLRDSDRDSDNDDNYPLYYDSEDDSDSEDGRRLIVFK